MLRQVAATLLLVSVVACGGGGASSSTLEARLPTLAAPVEPTAAASASRAEPSKPVAGQLTWETSEVDARARAKKRGLPLLIFACAAWSAACHAMERDVWTDPRVVALAPRFVWLKIDLTDTEGDAELTAERLGVAGVPMTIVLDPDGTRTYAEPQFVIAERMARELAAASARTP